MKNEASNCLNAPVLLLDDRILEGAPPFSLMTKGEEEVGYAYRRFRLEKGEQFFVVAQGSEIEDFRRRAAEEVGQPGPLPEVHAQGRGRVFIIHGGRFSTFLWPEGASNEREAIRAFERVAARHFPIIIEVSGDSLPFQELPVDYPVRSRKGEVSIITRTQLYGNLVGFLHRLVDIPDEIEAILAAWNETMARRIFPGRGAREIIERDIAQLGHKAGNMQREAALRELVLAISDPSLERSAAAVERIYGHAREAWRSSKERYLGESRLAVAAAPVHEFKWLAGGGEKGLSGGGGTRYFAVHSCRDEFELDFVDEEREWASDFKEAASKYSPPDASNPVSAERVWFLAATARLLDRLRGSFDVVGTAGLQSEKIVTFLEEGWIPALRALTIVAGCAEQGEAEQALLRLLETASLSGGGSWRDELKQGKLGIFEWMTAEVNRLLSSLSGKVSHG